MQSSDALKRGLNNINSLSGRQSANTIKLIDELHTVTDRSRVSRKWEYVFWVNVSQKLIRFELSIHVGCSAYDSSLRLRKQVQVYTTHEYGFVLNSYVSSNDSTDHF